MSARTRRAWPVILWWAGALGLAVGLTMAYLTRDDPTPVVALIFLWVGNVLVLAGTAWAVRRERTADGLVLPEGQDRLPPPAWWWPVGMTGVADVAAGPAASGWLGLVGAVLVAAALIGAGRALSAPLAGPDRTVVRAARRLRLIATADDAVLVGALEPVGRSGVRVVAVAADGRWVDVMLGSADRAEAAAALAGVALHDQADPAFSGAFAVGAGRWARLPGPS